jgi:transposase
VGDDGFAFIESIFEQIDASELIERLEQYRWTGRLGYSPDSMWRAVVLRYLLSIRYVRDLIAHLNTSQRLRLLCGFKTAVPSESTFSRFLKRLRDHQDLVDRTLRQMIHAAGKKLKNFGRGVALDSTDIVGFGKYRKEKRNADPDAMWGSRTSKDPQTKRQLFYGYKLHLACDARYGVPLAYTVLPANANDSPQLRVLFDRIRVEYPELKPKFAIADRGYDHLPNYRYLHRHKIGAVIAIRDTEKEGGIYSLEGRPRCEGKMDMDFVGTDRKKGHLFRCPESGCHLKDVVQFTKHCDLEFYEQVEQGEDVEQARKLRTVGKLARANPVWKRFYNKRGIVERLFGSAKQSRLLDTHRCFGIQRMRLHVALSLLAYTGTMLAHISMGQPKKMRQMDVRSGLSANSSWLAVAA